MKTKKRLISVIAVCAMLCLLVVSASQNNGIAQIPDDNVPMDGLKGLVVEGEHDITVIPDKYNSGCDEATITNVVNAAGKYGGLNFVLASGGTTLAVDFVYGNSKVADEIIIRDTDFSAYKIEFRNGSKVTAHKEIIFENCKFGGLRTDYSSGDVSYTFRRCSITNFAGSSADFDACYFGGTINDGLNPVQDVNVMNCYVSDLAHVGNKVMHSDGTQIYGQKGIDVQNITYKNCRMELPNLKRSGSQSGCYVNACLMVQLEYSDANNLLFEDCIINGGGYSIYAWDKKLGYELNDVVFRNIQVGNAHEFGNIYPTSAPTVVYDNVSNTEKLFVASVWKDDSGKIHLSVSNDTKDARVLVVVTENGKQEIEIPACYKAKEIPEDTSFEDMPFDIDIEVDNSGWVVCYDSYESEEQQIRFVNWSGENVFREESVQMGQVDASNEADTVLSGENVLESDENKTETGAASIEAEGTCGKTASYKLDADGTLTISGTGVMYNYNSSKAAPWKEYRSNITNVVIEDGVTGIGEQAFYSCKQIEDVSLPDTLENIGKNALFGCSSLTEISIPEAVSTIGSMAFKGTNVEKVYYAGDEETFESISIGSNNDELTNALIEYGREEEKDIEGACGKNVSYKLSSDGTMTISGTGVIYNYNSSKAAPWKEYKSNITCVIIEEGVTGIGEQAFYGCKQIEEISLPNTLESIGKNALFGCSSLTEILLPKTISTVGNMAFKGTNISKVYYAGSEEAFQNISIGSSNDELINASIEYSEEVNAAE